MKYLYNYAKKLINHEFVMPCIVEMHPTNRCNQRCVWCIMEKERENGEKLNSEQLLKIATDLKTNEVKYVFISGGGEPLTNENLFCTYIFSGKKYESFFELLSSFNIDIGMSTNGELIRKLIKTGCYKYINSLRVSIDAGNQEQYFKLHRSKTGCRLEDIVEYIQEYYRVSNKAVGITYLSCEENQNGEIELANRFLESEAVLYINVKALIEDKNFKTALGIDKTVNKISINYETMNIKTNNVNYVKNTNVLIMANGNVFPCCHCLVHGKKYLLGSILKESLYDLIIKSSDMMNNFHCSRCNNSEINNCLNKIAILENAYDKV